MPDAAPAPASDYRCSQRRRPATSCRKLSPPLARVSSLVCLVCLCMQSNNRHHGTACALDGTPTLLLCLRDAIVRATVLRCGSSGGARATHSLTLPGPHPSSYSPVACRVVSSRLTAPSLCRLCSVAPESGEKTKAEALAPNPPVLLEAFHHRRAGAAGGAGRRLSAAPLHLLLIARAMRAGTHPYEPPLRPTSHPYLVHPVEPVEHRAAARACHLPPCR